MTQAVRVREGEGFLKRQSGAWVSRYEKTRTEEVGEVEALTGWLLADIPESPQPTIIHNDYKLNNLILDPEDLRTVRAVLDWEMATVGDPLFDLAVSLSYWTEPEDLKAVMPTVTAEGEFLSRAELVEFYAHRSGRGLSRMQWYVIFGYFKLAVILRQIFARYTRGQTQDERSARFAERVRTLILHAEGLSRSGKV